VCTKLSKMTHL